MLTALHDQQHDVAAVASPAQDSSGRPDRLTMAAHRLAIPWIDAGELRADRVPDDVDLIVAAHSHAFIGARTRDRARLGAIGYHPSLLPRHRGRDAVRWTIRMGDPVAGGSVYWLTDNVDGGPIAAQSWCWVEPGDTASELWRRDLFPMGVRLILDVLWDLEGRRIVAVPQNERVATWEPALDAPPLFRPELPRIGGGPLEGYRIVAEFNEKPENA